MYNKNTLTRSLASRDARHGALANERLRILWVKMGGLWPANSGGRLRSFNILRELSQQHELTVLTTHSHGESAGALREQLPACRRVDSRLFTPPKSSSPLFLFTLAASWFSRQPVDMYKHQLPALRAEVGQLLASGQFDLCIVDFMSAVPNVPLAGATPVVLFSHNVEYMIWKRLHDNETHWARRLLLAIEWRKMRRAETRVCDTVAATITVSQDDAVLLRQGSPATRIEAVPTGVDVHYFTADARVAKRPCALVFSGSMDWFPNEDAMLYFLEEMLPAVQQQYPQVSLSIVGRHPTERLRAAALRHGVEVTGTVPDVRPWLDRACVYIVPLRIGGGTRLKIYEALSMGMAVVSTTIGAEGLDLTDDVHLLRADTPDTFASAVVRLLRDPALREALGEAGRDLMTEHHGWSQVARRFERLCRAALPASAMPDTPSPSTFRPLSTKRKMP